MRSDDHNCVNITDIREQIYEMIVLIGTWTQKTYTNIHTHIYKQCICFEAGERDRIFSKSKMPQRRGEIQESRTTSRGNTKVGSKMFLLASIV